MSLILPESSPDKILRGRRSAMIDAVVYKVLIGSFSEMGLRGFERLDLMHRKPRHVTRAEVKAIRKAWRESARP